MKAQNELLLALAVQIENLAREAGAAGNLGGTFENVTDRLDELKAKNAKLVEECDNWRITRDAAHELQTRNIAKLKTAKLNDARETHYEVTAVIPSPAVEEAAGRIRASRESAADEPWPVTLWFSSEDTPLLADDVGALLEFVERLS